MNRALSKNTLTAVCVLRAIELCLQSNDINDYNDYNPSKQD